MNIKLIDMDYENIVPHIFPILVQGGLRDHLFDKLKEIGVQCEILIKGPNVMHCPHAICRESAFKNNPVERTFGMCCKK